jgi:hypothetical protein
MGEDWTVERVSTTWNGNPAYFIDADLFGNVVHIEGTNANILFAMTRQFGELKNVIHAHQWSIRAFAEEPFIPQHQTPLAEEFPGFVCFANVFLNQTTQPSTKYFIMPSSVMGLNLGAPVRMQRSVMRVCSRQCLSAGFVKQLSMVMRRDCVLG